MLILGRTIGESIMVGDDIEVFVNRVQGFDVRIGIEAPANVAIHRKEIYLQIQEEATKTKTAVNCTGGRKSAVERFALIHLKARIIRNLSRTCGSLIQDAADAILAESELK